jgi:hypothetical protein
MAAVAERMRHFAPLAHRMLPPVAAATWTEQQQQQQQQPTPVGSAPPQLYPQTGPPPGYPAARDHFCPLAPQPRRNRFTYVAPGAQGNVGSFPQPPPPAAYNQGQPFPQATGPGYLPTSAPGYNTQRFTHHPAMMFGMLPTTLP